MNFLDPSTASKSRVIGFSAKEVMTRPSRTGGVQRYIGGSIRITQLATIGVILSGVLGHAPRALASGSFRSSISSAHVDLGEVFTFLFLNARTDQRSGSIREDDGRRRRSIQKTTGYSSHHFILPRTGYSGRGRGKNPSRLQRFSQCAGAHWWFGPLRSGIPDDSRAVPTRRHRQNSRGEALIGFRCASSHLPDHCHPLRNCCRYHFHCDRPRNTRPRLPFSC